MTQCIPETFSMLDWSLALIMGNIPPPRDPNDDDDDEDHCGCVSPKNCAKPRLWQLEQRVPAPRRNQQSSEAFSDSADVQRRFTSLPLEFGLANPGALDPAQEYTRRMIGAFEKIPGQSGGRIFPSKSKRTRGHVLMNDVTGEAEQPEYPEERRSPDDRVVMLSMAETGFHIYYRFAQSLETCQNPVLDTRYSAL